MPDLSQWAPQDVTNFLMALAAIGCGILSNIRSFRLGKAIIRLNGGDPDATP